MDRFREYGDPVVAFLKETYSSNASEFLPRSSLKIDYDEYCQKNGVSPCLLPAFTSTFPAQPPLPSE